jgi:orotidine-5'-phosphate decarboxylase
MHAAAPALRSLQPEVNNPESKISAGFAADPANARLIVALDYPDAESALVLVERLQGSVRWFKVGLELYLAAGNTIVQTLVRHGYLVFLDLKLHDIPNTVAGAVRTVSQSGASLLTIHASGGPAMIEAAANAASALQAPPKLLAVTVLTSIDQSQLEATGIHATPAAQVELLAEMAIKAGADGLICSPEESGSLRRKLGPAPLLVTPGIRPAGSDAGDQKRIATPQMALQSGASYLVVGRPITQASDPLAAAEAILAAMTAA